MIDYIKRALNYIGIYKSKNLESYKPKEVPQKPLTKNDSEELIRQGLENAKKVKEQQEGIFRLSEKARNLRVK